MAIKDNYNNALKQAKLGNLEEARTILLKIPHPKAQALLEKVNKAIEAKEVQKTTSHVPIVNQFQVIAMAIALIFWILLAVVVWYIFSLSS